MTRSLRWRAWALLTLVGAVASACHTLQPPAHWQQGGAPLQIPRARWVHRGHIVDLNPNGAVLVDGEHELTVDRAGRVYEPDGAPVALLEPDGRLVGPDDEDRGRVGAQTAALPGDDVAWLGLAPSGELLVYESDGRQRVFGVWMGCMVTPYTQQACLLVAHVLASEMREAHHGVPILFGFGVGVGF